MKILFVCLLFDGDILLNLSSYFHTLVLIMVLYMLQLLCSPHLVDGLYSYIPYILIVLYFYDQSVYYHKCHNYTQCPSTMKFYEDLIRLSTYQFAIYMTFLILRIPTYILYAYRYTYRKLLKIEDF